MQNLFIRKIKIDIYPYLPRKPLYFDAIGHLREVESIGYLIKIFIMQTATKFTSVGQYIGSFPAPVQERLKRLRAMVRKIVPKAEESISYNMPAYKYKGPFVYFAAFKNHIGLYATPAAHQSFKKEFAKYTSGKGSVQFPLDQEMPWALIEKLVKFKMKSIDEKK